MRLHQLLFLSLLVSVFGFNPRPCLLHHDNMDVYATSIHFRFLPIVDVFSVKLQCSRLLNARDFSSFASQDYPTQDIEKLRTNAQGTHEMVMTSLMKGLLYHCRCISINDGANYEYISEALSVTTRNEVSSVPVLSATLSITKSDDDILRLKWQPLAQDVTLMIVQISGTIPLAWNQNESEPEYQHMIDGDVAGLFEYEASMSNFTDGRAYCVRILFGNEKGNGTSNVLSFVTKFVYLESIEISVDDQAEMGALVPSFHHKLCSYAVMVSQRAEYVSFGITPQANVEYIRKAGVRMAVDQTAAVVVVVGADATVVDLDDSDEAELSKTLAEIEQEDTGSDGAQDERSDADTEIAAETQRFALDAAANATQFTIESGSGILYNILIIRGKDEFEVAKYQRFSPPQPVPCPKQKRNIIRYGSFHEKYKEWIIGFLVFVVMVLVRTYERTTRVEMNTLLRDQLIPEEVTTRRKNDSLE